MLSRQYRFDCLDDGDLPEARGDDDGEDEEDEGDLTNDIINTTKEIQENIAKELGKSRRRQEVQEPHSPLKKREPRVNKRKEVPMPKVSQKEPKKGRIDQVLVKKNSDMFPVDVRPETFRNNDVFDALTFDKASTFVHEHGMLQAKLKLKERNKNSQEKADDKLKEVQVPSGVDDAKDSLNKEARNLRPVNAELGEQMAWWQTERKEIIRNLPLETYGLSDSVATKPIELCHNLASNLTIDMFCPGGKKAVNTKQKTCRTKDGELAVETSEVYGDLDSVQDVLVAWNTLAAIWQKIFPEWPAAQIALRVIFKMKMFNHCVSRSGLNGAKEVMIAFSNRFLTSNSQRAASKKGPLTYERAKNLAGNVCVDMGYSREPSLVVKSAGASELGVGGHRGGQRGGHLGVQQGVLQGGQQATRQGGYQTGQRGGRGGGRGAAMFAGVVRSGSDSLCPFYQVRGAESQQHCTLQCVGIEY